MDATSSPPPTESPSSPLRRISRVTWAGFGFAAFLVALAVWPSADGPRLVPKPTPPPLPPIGETGYQNTAESEWVGVSACAECHSEIAKHYSQSSHASALAEVSPDAEPPDTEFAHPASGRRYRVYRKDGRLRHRETIATENGDDLVLADHPVSMVVGTGHQGRTYLVDLDGFLMQSPVTWYADGKRWRLAPGYDRGDHLSFERPIPVDCLICHAGRSESIDGAYHRVKVHERQIGCERCHGSGSLHVSARRQQADTDRAPIVKDDDRTIVHPGRLSRERLESVCAQCHLQNNAAANLRNRRLVDFRPGQRLAEYRAHYLLEESSGGMTVVGHVEQLHQSRCYTQTKTLTCTTCHDPHRHVAQPEAATLYRAKCLECHQPNACGLPADGMRRRKVADRCAACHMPQTTTEIPHVASTHHRIGIHDTDPDHPNSTGRRFSPGTLKPLHDLSHLPPLDQDRCLGLAYRQLASKQTDRELASVFRLRARRILRRTFDAGLEDAELMAALADLDQASNPADAGRTAARALERDSELTAQDRVNSLAVQANSLIITEQFADAVPVLERLVRLHRNAGAWLQLSQCRMSTGDIPGAIVAAERAVSIGPQRPEIRTYLARLLRQSGKLDQAREQQRAADVLNRGRRGGPARIR